MNWICDKDGVQYRKSPTGTVGTDEGKKVSKWALNLIGATCLLLLPACGNDQAADPEMGMANPEMMEEDHGHDDGLVLNLAQLEAGDMQLGTPASRPFHDRVRAAGNVDVPPEYKASVSAYYPGYVRQLKLIAGDRVRRGEQLFRIENPELIALQQSLLETSMDTARLNSEARRLELLARENIAAEKDAIAARAAVDRAKARLAGLSRQLSSIGIDPGKVSPENFLTSIAVRAPFSGHVTEVNATTGEYLTPGNSALNLINTDHIHLELEVFEKDIISLKEEQPIIFWLPSMPGKTGGAVIHRIGKTVEDDRRTVHVHADPVPGELTAALLPGMFVEAEILTGAGERKLAVPEEAVVNFEGVEYILIVEERKGDEVHFRQEIVSIGRTKDGWTEIVSGPELTTESSLLISGAHKLVGEGSAHAH
ncbi:efflux RND transporter periplasmic adaptor subunit [Lewinella sp. W8]|uniref:efflux RND transporter periplasmic adaptor subunit n=1 Tax=Lewinella sp. W8 TaxID=2528208 RepID=UPI0010683B2E|nr:efflux RND transporter periplasmic adaptor subunit [Lewinella sp. W8]MTB50137.1 efflux RND transporter periplasmic adaptor subunit [Lewinella sp. W8]